MGKKEFSLYRLIAKYIKEYRENKVWRRVTNTLAVVVVFVTTYALILPAITAAAQTICGMEEHSHDSTCYRNAYDLSAIHPACEDALHTHTQACYENGELTCGYADFYVHTHTDACYDDTGALICALPQIRTHAHGASCYSEAVSLACPLEETYAHTHTEDCIDHVQTKICDSPENHTHSDSCYTEDTLTCTIPEGHVHGADCYTVTDEYSCGLAESEGHTHNTSECYEIGSQLICEKKEIVLHTHTDACFKITKDASGKEIRTLTCGKTEIKEHTHTAACFDGENLTLARTGSTLICGKTEHTHDDTCYPADGATVTNGIGAILGSVANSDESGLDDAANAESGAADEAEDNGDASEQTPIDMTPHVDKVSIGKIEGNSVVYPEDGQFHEGDQVQVQIDYSYDADVIKPGNNVVYYQLPKNVKPNGTLSGKVLDQNGKFAGTYVIDENGLITITYDETYIVDGHAFPGTIKFTGSLGMTSDGESEQVTFPGQTEGNITIVPSETPDTDQFDISTQKSRGNVDLKTGTVNYTVTVSTNKGTEGTVDICDTLSSKQDANMQYNKGSFVLYKIDANGNREPVTGYEPTFTENADDSFGFEYKGLPQLAAGEKYEVSYSATATPGDGNTDGYILLNNKVVANSGDDSSSATTNATVSNTMINKNGHYDPQTGKIKWTITINPDKEDIGGYTLKDILLANGHVLEGTAFEDVSIVFNDTWGQDKELAEKLAAQFAANGNLTFSEGFDKKVQITYYTDASNLDSGTTVNNEVTMEHPDKPDYEGNGESNVNHRDWNASKSKADGNKLEPVEGQADTYRTWWNASIQFPGKDWETQSYTDQILNAVLNGQEIADSHYGVAGEILKAIQDSLELVLTDDKTKIPYNDPRFPLNVVLKDEKGNEITDTNSTEKVQSFQIVLTPKTYAEGETPENAIALKDCFKLNFKYPTMVNLAGIQEGDKWTFANQLDNSKPTFDYTEHPDLPPITKQVTDFNQWGNVNETGYGSNIEVFYDNANHSKNKVRFRIIIQTEEGQNGPLTITDTLPAGLEVIKDQWNTNIYPGFYIDGKKQDQCGQYKAPNNFTYEVIKNSDGTSTINMTFKEGFNAEAMNCGHVPHALVVEYDVSFDGDAWWEDPANEHKLYQNIASWNGNSDSGQVEVDREVDKVLKTMEQVEEDGKKQNVVKYYVTINPGGADIDPVSDDLTLTDTLTVPNGVSANLDLSRTKVYEYDASKPNCVGNEMNNSRYTVHYDPATYTITVKVPDEIPCVLVYYYKIDPGNNINAIQLTNKVTMMGTQWSDDSQDDFIINDSSATVIKAGLQIYKVDEDDHSRFLPGTVFEVEYWDEESQSWHFTGSYTTNEEGKLFLPFGRTPGLGVYNRLYKITEVVAPDGYEVDSKPMYIVPIGQESGNESFETLKNEFLSTFNFDAVTNQTEGFSTDAVQYLDGKKETTVTIPNKNKRLAVEKVWLDANGNELVDHPEYISVDLYKGEAQANGVPVTVKIFQTSQGYSEENEVSSVTYLVKANSVFKVKYNVDDNASGWYFGIKVNDDELGWYNWPNGYEIERNVGTEPLVIKYFIGEWAVGRFKPTPTYEPDHSMSQEGEYVTTVLLNASNNWSYIWDDLEFQDEAGNEIYYFIKETNVPDGYIVTYRNNNGIQTGVITVTNKAQKEQEVTTLDMKVVKQWHDASGETMTNLPEGLKVTFTIERNVQTVATGEYSGWQYFRTVTLPDENGSWELSLDDLTASIFVGGKEVYKYIYRVVETNVTGAQGVFDVSYDKNYIYATDTVTVTNTEKDTTNVAVQKVWNHLDTNTQIPDSLTLTLRRYVTADKKLPTEATELERLIDESFSMKITLTSKDQWYEEIENLPKDDENGNNFFYFISEENLPAGWELDVIENNGIQQGIIQVKNVTEKTAVRVSKIWDGTAPTTGELTLTLKRYQSEDPTQTQFTEADVDQTFISKVVTLDAKDVASHNWSHTFAGLDKTGVDKNGNTVYYTYFVEETDVPAGWKLQTSSNPGTRITDLTLTNVPDVTDMTVKKVWEGYGNRGDITFILKQVKLEQPLTGELTEEQKVNATEYKRVTLFASAAETHNWETTFKDLPKTVVEGGKTYYLYYFVEENVPAGWELADMAETKDENGNTIVTVTNKSDSSTGAELEVVKKWIVDDKEVTGEDLPYSKVTFNLIRYRSTAGKTVSVTAHTNPHNPTTAGWTGTSKVQGGIPVGSTVTVTYDFSRQGDINESSYPEYKDGTTITGGHDLKWESSKTGSSGYIDTLTATFVADDDVVLDLYVHEDFANYASIVISFTSPADGVETGTFEKDPTWTPIPITVSKDTGWKWSTTELPATGTVNGTDVAYQYGIEEIMVDGKPLDECENIQVSYDKDCVASGTITATNTTGELPETTEITVNKKFLGGVTEPEKVYVQVLCQSSESTNKWLVQEDGEYTFADNQSEGTYFELTKDGNWTLTLKDLPKKDEAGNAITYYVVETGVKDKTDLSGWKPTYSTAEMEDGSLTVYPVDESGEITITNESLTSISVEKKWFLNNALLEPADYTATFRLFFTKEKVEDPTEETTPSTTPSTEETTPPTDATEPSIEPTTPEVEKITITFNGNGGTPDPTSVQIDKGASIDTLPTVNRDGYTFDGWFTEQNGGNKVTTETVFSENTTVYAHWTDETTDPDPEQSTTYTVTVTSSDNGRVTASPNCDVNEGNTVTLKVAPADGYELETLTVTYGDNQTVAVSGEGDTRTFTMPAADVTVTASFKKIETGGGDTGDGWIRLTTTDGDKEYDLSKYIGKYTDIKLVFSNTIYQNITLQFGDDWQHYIVLRGQSDSEEVIVDVSAMNSLAKLTIHNYSTGGTLNAVYIRVAGGGYPDESGSSTVDYTITTEDAVISDVSQGATFISDADFAKFQSVQVDGVTVDSANYTAVSGSTKITFTADYLKSLSEGEHTITIVSSDGNAEATFMISNATDDDLTTIPDTTDPIKIMAIGDSITNGFGQGGAYRKYFYRDMVSADYQIDMVGDGPGSGGVYTDPDTGIEFDSAHTGVSGYTIKQIHEWLVTYNSLANCEPEIVMLMIGTNDVNGYKFADDGGAGDIFTRLKNLVEYIHGQRPNARIFLATIPPLDASQKTAYEYLYQSYYRQNGYSVEKTQTLINEAIETYNAYVKALSGAKGYVTLVDVNSRLSANTTDLHDGCHPSEVGYEKIGSAFANAVAGYLATVTPQSYTEDTTSAALSAGLPYSFSLSGYSAPAARTGGSVVMTNSSIPANAIPYYTVNNDGKTPDESMDVTLQAGNWKHTWSNLPEYVLDEDGVTYKYTYYVQEIACSAGNLTNVVYETDENGNTIVKNYLVNQSSPILPHTGGMGTNRYTLSGVVLITLAMLAQCIYTQRKLGSRTKPRKSQEGGRR